MESAFTIKLLKRNTTYDGEREWKRVCILWINHLRNSHHRRHAHVPAEESLNVNLWAVIIMHQAAFVYLCSNRQDNIAARRNTALMRAETTCWRAKAGAAALDTEVDHSALKTEDQDASFIIYCVTKSWIRCGQLAIRTFTKATKLL